jgi:hypothetical protein
MKANRPFVLLALVVGCCPGIAQTGTPFITLGSTQIRLGEQAAKAIADLQKDYVVQSESKTPIREWIVSARRDSIPMLTIFSKGDRIVGAQRLVGDRELSSAQEVFDSLYATADKVSSENRNRCSVGTFTDYVSGTGLSKAALTFDCGAYVFRLQRNQMTGDDGRVLIGYMVWEEFGSTR